MSKTSEQEHTVPVCPARRNVGAHCTPDQSPRQRQRQVASGKRSTLRGPCIGKAGAGLSFLACCAFAVSFLLFLARIFENVGDGTSRSNKKNNYIFFEKIMRQFFKPN
jgi:hypothetical protein